MSNKLKFILIVLGIGVLLFAIFASRFLVPKDPLKSALADSFRVPVDVLHINLPPANGRYPGAVFLKTDRLLPIEFASSDDDRFKRGQKVSLNVTLNAKAISTGSLDLGFFKQLSDSGKTKTVSLEISDVVPVEIRAGDLKSILLSSQDSKKAALNEENVYIISKAYEGQMVVTLKTSENTKTSAVIEDISKSMPSAEAKLSADKNKEDEIRVSFSEPTVFAYEMMEASFFSTSLSIEPDDVTLSLIPEAELVSAPSAKKKQQINGD